MNPLSPEEIKEINNRLIPVILEDRHWLHQYPELSFQEVNTSLYIQKKLDELGIEWKLCGDKGVVGCLAGELPGGRVVALRADFDALPIQEQSNLPYASRNKGVMHACGHDVHTAALLGVARILSVLTSRFRGTVKFIFQPAEEKYPGGARTMVKDGALKNPDADFVFAQHVIPELETGKVGFKTGKYAAANDEINIIIRGKGGHGAQPQSLIDPVIIAAQVILALQQLVSRVADPREPTVLSFGKVIADGANNIIPETVELFGTLRTFDKAWREKAHDHIKKIVCGIVEAMGGTAEIFIRGFSNVENDIELTNEAIKWSKEFLGETQVEELDYWMAGEDFGEFASEIPGCYYRIGSANFEKGVVAPLHHPRFDVEEESLFQISSALMSYIALKKLGN